MESTKVLEINKIYKKHMLNNLTPTQIYYGGSGAGKSVALAQRAILDLLNGRNYLIVRKVSNTIRQSVFAELIKIIEMLDLFDIFEINKTALTITCKNNGSQIITKGLDDVEKLKSITVKKGIITDIWIEEATEISFDDYKQLLKRLRGKSEHTKRVTLSFNPILKSHWIYREFFLDKWRDSDTMLKDGNVFILKSTYKNNNFLSEQDVASFEQETNEYYYNVYTLGNWGMLGNVIFTNIEVKEFDTEQFDKYLHGIDWGFGVDPFAYVKVAIQNNNLYILNEIYGRELLNAQVAELIKDLVKGDVVFCDSAEPKSIADLRQRGINAVKAKKGQGSVSTGIKKLQSFKRIYINPQCKNSIEEFRNYSWKKDKYGDVLPIPQDKDDHIIDATRYSMSYVDQRVGLSY